MIDTEACWQAVLAKDATQAGQFFYGVLTTGVYCRPGCASRVPLRANVRFYPNVSEAEADGLRACLRCKPAAAKNTVIRDRTTEIRAYIRKNLDDPERLTLSALSRQFEISPFHLQRTFKAALGVTPKKYVQELRMQTFKEDLRSGTPVTEAVYQAGFGSASRVYEQLDANLGMTPRQYKARGKGVAISYATIATPLGLLMIGATDRGLCFLEFGTSQAELFESLQQEFASAHIMPLAEPAPAEYLTWVKALSGFLEGEKALSKLPVTLHGTAFQLKVWNYLQTIPNGSVQSYAAVAEAIGHPKAIRAVGSACAANRIALLVPCHRVIRGDGGLGGYRWGLQRKRALLETERRVKGNAG